MRKQYFGTDGIRGKVGSETINPQFMLKLGWAVGVVLGQQHGTKILIGKDTRISGYLLESALQAGLSAAGIDVHLLGPMPTPAIAHLTHSLRAAAGVVISASHNLYEDNGVKFFDQFGTKLSDELELAIEAQLNQTMSLVPTQKLGKLKRLKDTGGRYIEFCKSVFPSGLTLNGIKLVVDCANGAAYDVAPNVFQELGATVIPIANHPDGLNINQNCGATDVKRLQHEVIANHADAGIALDGDGDRLIMVDQQGEMINGDILLCIMALYMENCPGVVGTVMSNLGLEKALTARKIPFLRASVGDRHVLEMLKKQNWTLGGESSGHIVNLACTTTGDGIISALQVLAIMVKSQLDLSKLSQLMEHYPQILINVPVTHKLDLSPKSKIGRALADAERELAKEGRILLRPSGTEPLVRIMVEGQSPQQVQQIAEHLADIVIKEAQYSGGVHG